MNPTSAHAPPTALIVPHTHWDREWRYPLWKNRALLVRFMKQLLEQLETDPSYRCFVLDGQAVAIEDYLEVCPEDRQRVEHQISGGRLKIGPWYTLPDLYPLDGECLVRNLLKGRRLARSLGGFLNIGYNSFGWGQTAQFPQIYAGFGIDFAIAAKRVSKGRAPHCEFWWEAPDGTRLLTTRLGKDARANGFFQLYIPVRHGMPYMDAAYRWEWGRSGSALHRADPDREDDDYFRTDAGHGYHPDQVKDAMQAAWDGMEETLATDYRLILTGSDFTSPLPVLTRIVRDAAASHPDKLIRMGTLEEYAAGLRERLDPDRIPVVTGELRDGPACACSGNALSTRIHIKQLNKRAENALIRRAEPIACALRMLGEPWPRVFLDLAWKHLLAAHPHDSINGVTQDKTAEDTTNRLAQALELADVAFEESLHRLVNRIDYSAFSPTDVLVLLVNPRPRPAREILEFSVDTPREDCVWDIGLAEADGTPLDCQHISRAERTCPVDDMEARPWPFRHDRHRVFADTGVIPAGGYKLLRVVPRRTFNRAAEWWPEMRTSKGADIARDPATLENRHLKASIQQDGTLTLLDKATGRTFPDLHWFEDSGDAGDYWAYYPPYRNRTFTTRGLQARIWLEDNGPLSATIACEWIMPVPKRANIPERGIQGDSCRSEETVPLPITSRFTLRRDSRRLDIRTRIVNTAEDHRMRVLFPTGFATVRAESAGHFTVDSRPNVPPRDTDGEFWPEMQTLPQQVFVAVSDGQAGLAILNNCLTEYQLLEDGRGTLALTLFRAVRNRICTEFRSSGNFPGQKGGQCLRTLEYQYAVYPHAGGWREGRVYPEAMDLNTPLAAVQVSANPSSSADLPSTASLFSLSSPDLVLSAGKPAEDRDSCIIRVFNPTRDTVSATLNTAARNAQAWLTSLDEDRLDGLAVSDGSIGITVAAGKILTVEVDPGAPRAAL